jgi:hypothetical protein
MAGGRVFSQAISLATPVKGREEARKDRRRPTLDNRSVVIYSMKGGTSGILNGWAPVKPLSKNNLTGDISGTA